MTGALRSAAREPPLEPRNDEAWTHDHNDPRTAGGE